MGGIALGVAFVVVSLGVPGFLVGVGAGVLIRGWLALLLFAPAGGLALLFTLRGLDNGGDDDSNVFLIVALATNYLGFLIGVALSRLPTRNA